MESIAEKILYASRWLLAPIYLGLSLALLLLGIKFFQEVFHTLPLVLETAEANLVLLVLSLVDLSLVGGLIVMVMLSGYPNPLYDREHDHALTLADGFQHGVVIGFGHLIRVVASGRS